MKKESETKQPKVQIDEVKVLSPRIYIDEYVSSLHGLTPVQKAGFKAYASKEYMRLEEWESLYQQYKER